MFGTLNVRTLGNDVICAKDAIIARLPQFTSYFLKNNIKTVLFFLHSIFSGNLDLGTKAREYGIGMTVHISTKQCIKHIEPVNNRIMWLYVEDATASDKYVVFSVYGPTNPSDVEIKNRFWSILDKAFEN